MAFNQENVPSLRSRLYRRRQAARPTTHDDQIIKAADLDVVIEPRLSANCEVDGSRKTVVPWQITIDFQR